MSPDGAFVPSPAPGGAIFVESAPAADICSCAFVGNAALSSSNGASGPSRGGALSFANDGVYMYSEPPQRVEGFGPSPNVTAATVSACTFEENAAGEGGAVAASQRVALVIDGCALSANAADSRGGALALFGDPAPAASSTAAAAVPPPTTLVTGNTAFVANNATGGGAVVAVSGVHLLTFSGVSVVNNTAPRGAVVYLDPLTDPSAPPALSAVSAEGNAAEIGGFVFHEVRVRGRGRRDCAPLSCDWSARPAADSLPCSDMPPLPAPARLCVCRPPQGANNTDQAAVVTCADGCDLLAGASASNYGPFQASLPQRFDLEVPGAVRSGAAFAAVVVVRDAFGQSVHAWPDLLAEMTVEALADAAGGVATEADALRSALSGPNRVFLRNGTLAARGAHPKPQPRHSTPLRACAVCAPTSSQRSSSRPLRSPVRRCVRFGFHRVRFRVPRRPHVPYDSSLRPRILSGCVA